MTEDHAGSADEAAADRRPREVPRVLVPTDFSNSGEAAFVHGLRLAIAVEGRLTLLHCGAEGRDAVPWDRFPSVRGTLVRWGMVPPETTRAEVAARLNVDVVKMAVRDDDPRQGIIDYVRRNPSDLLALYSRGRAGMARLFNPSIAETVAFRSRTPALILPRGSEGFIDAATGTAGLSRVLCALEFGDDQRNALSFLAHWLPAAGSGGIEITLLQRSESERDSPPLLPKVARLSWQALYRPLDEIAAIVASARDVSAQLIVMNATRPSRLPGRVQGSRLDSVMRELGLPVLALPQG
jgi:nucleotide-binding universal stress UspA family protein